SIQQFVERWVTAADSISGHQCVDCTTVAVAPIFRLCGQECCTDSGLVVRLTFQNFVNALSDVIACPCAGLPGDSTSCGFDLIDEVTSKIVATLTVGPRYGFNQVFRDVVITRPAPSIGVFHDNR